MNKLDVNNLLSALDNENNSSIMKYTSKKLNKFKNDILQQIQLPRETLKIYHKKLKEYRYCSELCDFTRRILYTMDIFKRSRKN